MVCAIGLLASVQENEHLRKWKQQKLVFMKLYTEIPFNPLSVTVFYWDHLKLQVM